MRRGKSKKKWSGVKVSVSNNNIVQSKQDLDSSGKKKTEPSEISNCGDNVTAKQSFNSGSSIPPICQEFLDVVSGMGLKITPVQELESERLTKREKDVPQRDQTQWMKSNQVMSSKSNKAHFTDTQQNSNSSKVVQPVPGTQKECKREEKRTYAEVFKNQSVRSVSYEKPPGHPQYSAQQKMSGTIFQSTKSGAVKIKGTKLDIEVKDENEAKGCKQDQPHSKVEAKPVWNKNKKPISKVNNEICVKSNKKNESRLLDSKSEVKVTSSCISATHDVSWNIDKYKTDQESALRWEYKKKFLEKNKGKYPEEELVSLAQAFCNSLFLGCKYSQETTELVSQLGSDLAAEYNEMKKLKYFANLPPAAAVLKPEKSTEPSFYCTDIRYRESTDKVLSQSFVNQGSKSSAKQVAIKQVTRSSKNLVSHSSNTQVSQSSLKPTLVVQKKTNREKTVKSIEELEPEIVSAAFDVLSSSKPISSMKSSQLHDGVLKAVGHVPRFTKIRLHDILSKHPSSFKISSWPLKVDKNPTISLVENEKRISEDCETDPSFYTGVNKTSFVYFDEDSFEFDDNEDPEPLFAKEESVLTLESEIKVDKTVKSGRQTIVTLTESDTDEALKETVANIDWADLVEERDLDHLNKFSDKVVSIVNKLNSGQNNIKVVARELKKLPINHCEDELDKCASLIFGMAVDDQTLTASCADLCKYLESVKAPKEGSVGQSVHFRRLLLLKLQSEFEKAYSSLCVIASDTKLNDKVRPEKIRFLGIVKFAGELYRVSMLTTRIVDECLSKLVVNSNDVLLEAGCRLLEGVGLKFINETRIKIKTDGGIKNADDYYKQLQDIYFSKKLESSLSNLLKKIIANENSIQ